MRRMQMLVGLGMKTRKAVSDSRDRRRDYMLTISQLRRCWMWYVLSFDD